MATPPQGYTIQRPTGWGWLCAVAALFIIGASALGMAPMSGPILLVTLALLALSRLF